MTKDHNPTQMMPYLQFLDTIASRDWFDKISDDEKIKMGRDLIEWMKGYRLDFGEMKMIRGLYSIPNLYIKSILDLNSSHILGDIRSEIIDIIDIINAQYADENGYTSDISVWFGLLTDIYENNYHDNIEYPEFTLDNKKGLSVLSKINICTEFIRQSDPDEIVNTKIWLKTLKMRGLSTILKMIDKYTNKIQAGIQYQSTPLSGNMAPVLIQTGTDYSDEQKYYWELLIENLTDLSNELANFIEIKEEEDKE